MTETTPLRERLAALEHEQWAHWTRHLLDHLTPENVERWRRQIDTPYERLSEAEKRSDREWADRVLELFKADEGQKSERRVRRATPGGRGGQRPTDRLTPWPYHCRFPAGDSATSAPGLRRRRLASRSL